MTSSDTELQSDKAIVDLLTQQRDIYRRLEQLAARQRGLVRQEDTSELLSVLARRRELTDTLMDIGRRLAPLRADWAATQAGMAYEARGRADALIAESQKLLRSIMEGDEQDARQLSARKEQISSRIRSAGADRATMAAYGGFAMSNQGGSQRMNEVADA